MDTTPKYIKMCEKAGEIQAEWVSIIRTKDWDCSDFVYDKLNENSYCMGGETGLVAYGFPKNFIWLPRQDQLQEILKGGIGAILDEFHDFVILAEHYKEFDSWEQLWLAFVMHEKYGKIWDDEKGEWVKPPATT